MWAAALHGRRRHIGPNKAVVSFNIRQRSSVTLRSRRATALTNAGVLFYQKGVNLLNAAKNLQDGTYRPLSGLGGEVTYYHYVRDLAGGGHSGTGAVLVSAIPDISVFGICPHHIMPI